MTRLKLPAWRLPLSTSAALSAKAEIEGPPRRAIVPGTGGTLVVHHNAPFLPHALWALGRARVRGRRVIGYWAWEFPRIPDSWLAELALSARSLGAERTCPHRRRFGDRSAGACRAASAAAARA